MTSDEHTFRTNVRVPRPRAADVGRGGAALGSCVGAAAGRRQGAAARPCEGAANGSREKELRLSGHTHPEFDKKFQIFKIKSKGAAKGFFFKLYHNLTIKVKFPGRTPASSRNLKFEKALKFLYNIYRK